MSPAADPSAARSTVTAVVVSHDGAAWIPHLLTALVGSTRQPDLLVAVDTGSLDDSVDLLRAALGGDQVVEVSRSTGFGAAVAAGLPASVVATPTAGRHTSPSVETEEWVWLLHDDCAPASDALERLLETAAGDERIAAVGCRVRAWPRARRLLEVGVTITGTGRRETGLEPGEYDQGQYDEVRDVLAVSSAGMLVRRRVWDALGGFDARLPLFRDDVDFGWRAAASGYRVVVAPRAVMFHAEAASRGVREIASTTRRPYRADRQAGIFTVLANCRAAALPFLYGRLLLGSLLRAVGYLLGKLPGAAWDEVVAAGATLARPWQIVAARRWRRSHRSGRAVSAHRLLPHWWSPYAAGLDSVLSRLSEALRHAAGSLASSTRRLRRGYADPTVLESGPVPDEAVSLPTGDGPLAAAARHPLVALTGLLTVAGVVASRGLWGGGFLQGGGLLPAPDGAGAWWRLFIEGRHPVGLGSGLDAAPYVALLALPATVLLGKAWLVVDALMLFSPVLAGIGAWVASGRLVRGLGVRVWMAATYALVPVVIGAVASGHLGTVVVSVLLPWVAMSACRILDLELRPRWGTAWATGLTLAVATAFAPACWPVAVVLGALAVGWLVLGRQWVRAAQWLLALALPILLLLPWSWRVLGDPGLALTEAGAVVAPGSSASHAAWHLAFFRADVIGEAPWWLTAGATLVALAALLRSDTRGRVVAAWSVVAVGLAAAAAMAGQLVTRPLGGGEAHSWLGVPLVVVAAGLVAAAGIGADGLASFVGSGSFGWRQPVAAVAVVVGLTAPLLALGWWVSVASHGDLRRSVAVPVPAYMVDAMATSGARVLVLRTGTATVRYQVLAGDGYRLGDDSVLPEGGTPRLHTIVGDVLSEGGAVDVPTLVALGVRYIVLPSPQSPAAVARLDALPGLSRTSTEQAALSGWQVDQTPATGPLVAHQSSREGEVLGLAVLWTLVVVLAAPGVRRRPLQAAEAPR